MGWFNKNYIIISLLVLTQNFATNFANDVISKHETLSKVLTSFLKVPWIDLNSSWTDGVASTCKNDIVTLFESADAGEMWALQSKKNTYFFFFLTYFCAKLNNEIIRSITVWGGFGEIWMKMIFSLLKLSLNNF